MHFARNQTITHTQTPLLEYKCVLEQLARVCLSCQDHFCNTNSAAVVPLQWVGHVDYASRRHMLTNCQLEEQQQPAACSANHATCQLKAGTATAAALGGLAHQLNLKAAQARTTSQALFGIHGAKRYAQTKSS